MGVEFDVTPELLGDAEVTRLLDAKIEGLRQMVLSRPTRDQVLNEYDVLHWQRKFCVVYGKVLGNIEGAVMLGRLSPTAAVALDHKVKAMLQYHSGLVMLGGQDEG